MNANIILWRTQTIICEGKIIIAIFDKAMQYNEVAVFNEHQEIDLNEHQERVNSHYEKTQVALEKLNNLLAIVGSNSDVGSKVNLAILDLKDLRRDLRRFLDSQNQVV